jgi:hypothetical protein
MKTSIAVPAIFIAAMDNGAHAVSRRLGEPEK